MNMELVEIAGAGIVLAIWTKSTFLNVMTGLATITAGVDWIIQDPTVWSVLIVGSAIIAVGLYLLIMVGVDLLKGD